MQTPRTLTVTSICIRILRPPPRPASQQLTDKVWTESSKELIGDLDGDVIFYGIYGKPEDSPLAEYTNDPLWQQLSAVKVAS